MNIAAGIRYEFWLIIPLIWIWIFTNTSISVRDKVFASVCLLIFPVFWIGSGFAQSGDPLCFLHTKLQDATAYPPDVPYFSFIPALTMWTKRLFDLIGISGVMLAMWGMKVSWSNQKKQIFYTLLPIFFFITLVVQVYFGTMEFAPQRYLYSVFITLIPFIALSIHLGAAKLFVKTSFTSIIMSLSTMFFVAETFVFHRDIALTQRLSVQIHVLPYAKNVADFLKKITIDDGATIYYVYDDWEAKDYIEYFINKPVLYQKMTEVQESRYVTGDILIFDWTNRPTQSFTAEPSMRSIFQSGPFIVRYVM